MKKIILLGLTFIVLLFISGCGQQYQVPIENKNVEIIDKFDWKDAELTDIITGNKFKISDFEGKPVLLESFAVWCPTCKAQQDQIKLLHEELGDSVISISMDTDQNEDENKVLQHVNTYGYDWRFVVPPIEVTRALISEFGVTVVYAPGAPTILICEDQSTRLLRRGVKSSNDLKSEIAKGC